MSEFKDKNYRVTTLLEFGPSLPVITRDKDKRFIKDRSFTFVEWNMELEEEISEIQKKEKNTGLFVNKMLCKLLDTICGEPFQELSEGEQQSRISSLEFPNIMYMYTYLRVDELGNILKTDPVTCPRCGKLNENFAIDLNTLEIHVKDEEHIREVDYELYKPISYKENKLITNLKLDVSKWKVLEGDNIGPDLSSGKFKRCLLEGAIIGAKDESGPIDSILDVRAIVKKIQKKDIECCIKTVIENNSGCDMGAQGTCIHCKADFYKLLDWKYDRFFDSSSL